MYVKNNYDDGMMSMCCDTCDSNTLMCMCGYWSWMWIITRLSS